MSVAVWMVTYNHGDFIERAIESVLIQKTNFKYKIYIGEDFSTDSTREICIKYAKEFPDKIELILQEKNIGAFLNGSLVYKFCLDSEAKYIAMCEGDDYWTDPLKLQKQVDFLEANDIYGLVHTDFYIYNEKLKRILNHFPKSYTNSSCFYDLLTENNFIGTLTVCFRKQLLLDYFNEIKPNEQNWLLGDLPIWLYVANKSKIHFINEITAVYRRLNESASNFQNYDSKINFEESVYDIRMFFYQKFSSGNSRIKKRINFLFSTNKLRINVFHNGSLFQFISLFMSSLYFVSSIKHFLTVLKLGLLKLRFYFKKIN